MSWCNKKQCAGTECILVDVYFDGGTIDNQTTELMVGLCDIETVNLTSCIEKEGWPAFLTSTT